MPQDQAPRHTFTVRRSSRHPYSNQSQRKQTTLGGNQRRQLLLHRRQLVGPCFRPRQLLRQPLRNVIPRVLHQAQARRTTRLPHHWATVLAALRPQQTVMKLRGSRHPDSKKSQSLTMHLPRPAALFRSRSGACRCRVSRHCHNQETWHVNKVLSRCPHENRLESPSIPGRRKTSPF